MQIHLFDIEIPGDITFKESDFFAAGDKPNIVHTGIYDLDSNLKYHQHFLWSDYILEYVPSVPTAYSAKVDVV